MIKNIIIFIISSFTYCTHQNKENNDIKIINNSPYSIYFKSLKISNLTDTVLVQSQTKIFGCGTAVTEYKERLKTSGLDKFYRQYGDVLSDSTLIKQFEKDNNTKILWVFRGYEGEFTQLKDKELHANIELEKRLFKEKCFIKFSEEPITLDTIKIYTTVAYPKEQKANFTIHNLINKNNNWLIDKVTSKNWINEKYKQAYYP